MTAINKSPTLPPMKTVEFEAVYGDETKKVQLTAPSGGEGVQVIIDNYYQGMLFKRQGKWVGYFNEDSNLTADDVQILGEMIDNSL